jgi:hypothetical protein
MLRTQTVGPKTLHQRYGRCSILGRAGGIPCAKYHEHRVFVYCRPKIPTSCSVTKMFVKKYTFNNPIKDFVNTKLLLEFVYYVFVFCTLQITLYFSISLKICTIVNLKGLHNWNRINFSNYKICVLAHAAELIYLPEKLLYKLTQSVSFTDTMNDYEVRTCTLKGNVRNS